MRIEKKIPCEIFSRACGYFRPISQYNKGKKAEFWDRNRFLKSVEDKNGLVVSQ